MHYQNAKMLPKNRLIVKVLFFLNGQKIDSHEKSHDILPLCCKCYASISEIFCGILNAGSVNFGIYGGTYPLP